MKRRLRRLSQRFWKVLKSAQSAFKDFDSLMSYTRCEAEISVREAILNSVFQKGLTVSGGTPLSLRRACSLYFIDHSTANNSVHTPIALGSGTYHPKKTNQRSSATQHERRLIPHWAWGDLETACVRVVIWETE